MRENIKISLRTFGNRKLSALLDCDEIKGKSIEEVINHVLDKEWTNENKRNREMIKRDVSACTGYTPSRVITKEDNSEIFYPLKKEEFLENYLQDNELTEEEFTIDIESKGCVLGCII